MELNEIGILIKEARKSKRLTREALGRTLGMIRATFFGIETGKIAEVGLRQTMILCAVIGFELDVSPRRCSCPYKTDHSAAATSRINSLGDFSFNPL